MDIGTGESYCPGVVSVTVGDHEVEGSRGGAGHRKRGHNNL